MTGKRDVEDRQQDFFGAPTKSQSSPTAARGRSRPSTPPPDEAEADNDRLHRQLARLSVPELRALMETLSNEALAELVLATIRQLKRRLARGGRNGQKGRASALDRAVQQLMAELGGHGSEDDF